MFFYNVIVIRRDLPHSITRIPTHHQCAERFFLRLSTLLKEDTFPQWLGKVSAVPCQAPVLFFSHVASCYFFLWMKTIWYWLEFTEVCLKTAQLFFTAIFADMWWFIVGDSSCTSPVASALYKPQKPTSWTSFSLAADSLFGDPNSMLLRAPCLLFSLCFPIPYHWHKNVFDFHDHFKNGL